MCEFISWIETKDKGKKTVFFLTGKQVFHTKRGKELRNYTKNYGDLVGHGAIRWYYELKYNVGTNKECTDFYSPENFPEDIVSAIKNGDMRGMGTPEGLLAKAACAEWDKACAECDKARAEWNKACAEWDKACAEWNKACAEWNKACAECDKARAEWNKACAEWDKACAECDKARAEWNKACAEWDKACAEIFWDLFAIPENRYHLWR
jgi:hypothetical protein